jgi:iron(III) transport system substrate-binding protein
MSKFPLAFCLIFSTLLALSLGGCVQRAEEEVVVYAALDKEFSEPILKEFQEKTGIKFVPKFDVESNKTVGLTTEIIQTADQPRADVFWNNEILHTLRLKKLGLLDTYPCPGAKHYPGLFRSTDGEWFGFAARARVLIINTDLLPDPSQRPSSIHDLVDPKWKGNCGIAKPLFGTTATQAAVMFSQWGEEKAQSFFTAAKDNANIESGNKQVALNVAAGRYAWGITDTDDAIIEVDDGRPVMMIFPDQADDQTGTLLIPNTLCLIKNGPNRDNAQRLVDFLLTAHVEDQLAVGRSAQFPLSSQAKEKSRSQPDDLKVMKVDFEAAAEQWDSSSKFLAELFR